MKRLALILSLLLSATAGFAQPKVSPAEAEVRATIAAWADAVKERDSKRLELLFADDLYITDYNGGVRGKKEEIEVLKPTATSRTISVINEDLRVRLYERATIALVTGVVRMVFETDSKQSPFAMRYTSVWEKRDRRWQLTALHTSRLPPTK